MTRWRGRGSLWNLSCGTPGRAASDPNVLPAPGFFRQTKTPCTTSCPLSPSRSEHRLIGLLQMKAHQSPIMRGAHVCSRSNIRQRSIVSLRSGKCRAPFPPNARLKAAQAELRFRKHEDGFRREPHPAKAQARSERFSRPHCPCLPVRVRTQTGGSLRSTWTSPAGEIEIGAGILCDRAPACLRGGSHCPGAGGIPGNPGAGRGRRNTPRLWPANSGPNPHLLRSSQTRSPMRTS